MPEAFEHDGFCSALWGDIRRDAEAMPAIAAGLGILGILQLITGTDLAAFLPLAVGLEITAWLVRGVKHRRRRPASGRPPHSMI